MLMEQEVLVRDILPYMGIWTAVMVLVWSILWYHARRFEKKHPEIFELNSKDEEKNRQIEKKEWQRQYSNKTLLLSYIIMIWAIGMVAILTPQKRALILGGGLLLILVLLFMGMQSKPKK